MCVCVCVCVCARVCVCVCVCVYMLVGFDFLNNIGHRLISARCDRCTFAISCVDEMTHLGMPEIKPYLFNVAIMSICRLLVYHCLSRA